MKILKSVIGLVAGMGAGAIVTNIVSAAIPKDTNKISKIGYVLGGICIVGIVSDKASKYAEDLVEQAEEGYKNIKELTGSVNLDKIEFDTKEKAEDILNNMEKLLADYGNVTLSDVLTMLGLESGEEDTKKGWDELYTARVHKYKEKYLLLLPRMKVLEGDDK